MMIHNQLQELLPHPQELLELHPQELLELHPQFAAVKSLIEVPPNVFYGLYYVRALVNVSSFLCKSFRIFFCKVSG